MLTTQIIRKSNSWKEFKEHLQGLTKKEKGDCFEALTKYYLEISPKYKTKLQNVWDLRGLPTDIRNHLNLPPNDEGIDLIAKTKEGGFWAIQCKYRSDELKSLTRHHIDTFTSLTFKTCKNFELALVCTTAERFSAKFKVLYGTDLSLCCGDVWRSLDQRFFQRLHSYLDDKVVLPDRNQPRPHQQTAISKAYEHFVSNGNSRGKLIMPCAAGKSLASYWMAKNLGAKKILLAVPSLALIRQTLEVWANQSLAEGQEVHWICVCSDTSVKDVGKDDPIVFTQDLGVLVHTDPDNIAEWLGARSDTTTLVITTYQSGKAIAEASRKADFSFDLGIMDEAHKTVGKKKSLFSHLLFDENIPIKHRLFMTATERRYKGNSEQILSMEDPEIYGDTFYLLSFKEALECQPRILTDYIIVIFLVTRSEVAGLIKENRHLRLTKTSLGKPIEAETLATAIALRKAMGEHPISHAISFHSSVMRASEFKLLQEELTPVFPEFESLETFHVSGTIPTGKRSRQLDSFANSPKALITNARCLTEGVDLPGIDCVVFVDPKKSVIDIVQATGRVLRPSPGKKLSYVIIPLLIEEENPTDQLPNNSSFNSILTVLKALASHDERIIEYFRDRSLGRPPKSASNIVEINMPISLPMDPHVFAESVVLQLRSRFAKLQWKLFNEARDFARSLGLRNRNEWNRYCKGQFPEKGTLPEDIPSYPDGVYKDRGWIGIGDWLGTGRIANQDREYRPFEEARDFARSLSLESKSQWARYCKGEYLGKEPLPKDIPANPPQVYKNEWTKWGDWCGSGTEAPRNRKYRTFEEAREFVRNLLFRNTKEWRKYCNGKIMGKIPLPTDIPANPPQVYKNEWIGWGDWFGTDFTATWMRKYRPFEEARQFVKNLSLNTIKEWRKYCKGEIKKNLPLPSDIPADPRKVYEDEWQEWGDWLGTYRIANWRREYLSFEDAREFARSLVLQSQSEWQQYCKGELPDKGIKPDNIPSDPRRTYKDKGWIDMGDWLGTGTTAPQHRKYRPFDRARDFVRRLGLRNQTEWNKFCKGELLHKVSLPEDIPTCPYQVYRNRGWEGLGDWLGSGAVANRNRQYRSFENARDFVRRLGLKGRKDWKRYCKEECLNQEPLPSDIPANPPQVYKDQWIGWGDWFGTYRIANTRREYLSFKAARGFARSLGLQSQTEWQLYCRGELPDKGIKPDNIPSDPRRTYKDKGWIDMGDWLGTGRIAPQNMEYLPFRKARDFARSLGLRNRNEWNRYCKSEFLEMVQKPDDVPANPQSTYKDKGWQGWGVWLGTRTVTKRSMEHEGSSI